MEIIYYKSSLSWFKLKASDKGLTCVQFCSPPTQAINTSPKSDILKLCVKELNDYFNQKLKTFTTPLDWTGATPFQKSVWTALLDIPYGKTVSYLDIANTLNNPKSVRAVGGANGKNPISIIVPCHRVIAKSGKLQGFASGLQNKAALLKLENPKLFNGTNYSLF